MCFYDLISGRIDTCKLIRREKNLVECENIKLTEKHKKMLVQYKAAIAISQYLQERWKNKGKI